MAIKVSNTTVIDNSRNLSNIVNATLSGTLSAGGGTGTSGQVLTSNGASAPSWQDAGGGGGLQSVQVFTSSGTWTRPSGITKVKIYVTGGGGGASRVSQGGGEYGPDAASGGGTAIKFALDVSSISSATITVGAGGFSGNNTGGTSSWSDGTNTISATGGSHSGYYTEIGGVGSGGDLNLRGGTGLHGSVLGGFSFWSEGGYEAAGSLGSGAGCPSNQSYKSGGDGIVVVEEYA